MLIIMIPIIAKLKFIMFLLPFQISFQNSKPDNLCVDGIVTHHLMVCNKFLVIFLDFYTDFSAARTSSIASFPVICSTSRAIITILGPSFSMTFSRFSGVSAG